MSSIQRHDNHHHYHRHPSNLRQDVDTHTTRAKRIAHAPTASTLARLAPRDSGTTPPTCACDSCCSIIQPHSRWSRCGAMGRAAACRTQEEGLSLAQEHACCQQGPQRSPGYVSAPLSSRLPQAFPHLLTVITALALFAPVWPIDLVHCQGCGRPKLHHHICGFCYGDISRRQKAAARQQTQSSPAAEAAEA